MCGDKAAGFDVIVHFRHISTNAHSCATTCLLMVIWLVNKLTITCKVSHSQYVVDPSKVRR